MKVRNKETKLVSFSRRFNIHGIGEMVIQNKEFGADSVYIKDYEVFLEKTQIWKDMRQAFKDKDIIIDNYNTIFLEPRNEEDKIRGYTL